MKMGCASRYSLAYHGLASEAALHRTLASPKQLTVFTRSEQIPAHEGLIGSVFGYRHITERLPFWCFHSYGYHRRNLSTDSSTREQPSLDLSRPGSDRDRSNQSVARFNEQTAVWDS